LYWAVWQAGEVALKIHFLPISK